MKNDSIGRCAVLVAALVLGTACNQQAAFDRLVPKEEAAYGKQVFEQVRRRQFEPVEAVLNPAATAGAPARPLLEQMAAAFPPEEPKIVRVIGALTNRVNDSTEVNLTFEYEFPREWMVSNIVFREAAGNRTIEGLHVRRTSGSQARLNAFSLQGKRPGQYVMLIAVVLVPVFIVATFAVLLKTKMLRHRWLWALVVLLGLGQVSMNWTTGETGVQILRVFLLGAGFFKAGPYGPLTLTCSVPVGAMVFLWKRRELMTKTPPPTSDADAPV